MKKINLAFGLMLLACFLATGYYMASYFRPEHLNEITMRMQIRASHVYLLFIALLNLLAFRVELTPPGRLTTFFERTFRVMLIAAGCVAVAAFIFEHTGDLKDRKLTLTAVILSLASVMLVLLHGIVAARKAGAR
jgi:hypothetical protein